MWDGRQAVFAKSFPHPVLPPKEAWHRVFELRHLLGIVRSLSCAIYSTKGVPSKNGPSRLDQRRLLKSRRLDLFILRLNWEKQVVFAGFRDFKYSFTHRLQS